MSTTALEKPSNSQFELELVKLIQESSRFEDCDQENIQNGSNVILVANNQDRVKGRGGGKGGGSSGR